MTLSFGRQDVNFSGSNTYTLTTSYVASDSVDNGSEISLKYVKKLSVYAYYTPSTNGNSLQYQVEINPYDIKEDPTNLKWVPIGKYVDAAGTWTEEKGSFTTTTSTTGGAQYNAVPLDIIDPSARRIRILAKETLGGGGAAGTVKFVIGTNTIN